MRVVAFAGIVCLAAACSGGCAALSLFSSEHHHEHHYDNPDLAGRITHRECELDALRLRVTHLELPHGAAPVPAVPPADSGLQLPPPQAQAP